MRFEVNIEKKSFAFILFGVLALIGVVGVIAYGTSSPSTFGHSVGELNWAETINANINVSKNITANMFCIGGSCINSWGGTGGSSQWTTSGNNIEYNAGNVLIKKLLEAGNVSVDGISLLNGPVWISGKSSQSAGPLILYPIILLLLSHKNYSLVVNGSSRINEDLDVGGKINDHLSIPIGNALVFLKEGAYLTTSCVFGTGETAYGEVRVNGGVLQTKAKATWCCEPSRFCDSGWVDGTYATAACASPARISIVRATTYGIVVQGNKGSATCSSSAYW